MFSGSVVSGSPKKWRMGPRNPWSPAPLGAPGVDICRGSQRRGPTGGDRVGERNEEAKFADRWYTWRQKRPKPGSNREEGMEKYMGPHIPRTPLGTVAHECPKMSQRPVGNIPAPIHGRICAQIRLNGFGQASPRLQSSWVRAESPMALMLFALASAASNRLINQVCAGTFAFTATAPCLGVLKPHLYRRPRASEPLELRRSEWNRPVVKYYVVLASPLGGG